MADYYPLIARAIEGLSDKSPAVRRAVYERARNALVTQLQSLQPPVALVDIERERTALDIAIGSVEALYVLPSPQTAVEAQLPPEPSQVLLEPLDARKNMSRPAAAERAQSAMAPRRNPDNAPDMASGVEEAAPPAAERPRIGTKHHSSGQDNRARVIILVASVLAMVVSIASWKLYDRQQQAKMQALAERQASEAAESGGQSETGKFTDRLGGGMVQETTAQANGNENAVAVQKAFLFETDPTTMRLPPASQKIIASEGLTKWSLEQKSARPGAPLDAVIHGEVEFPQVGFKLDFQMSRNNDGSAVSHLITLSFFHKPGDNEHNVVNIGKVQMKDNPADTSSNTLNVSLIPVAPNVFVLGLADISAQVEYNLQLLQGKNWIVIDFLFPDGRLGSVSMEKGSIGFQAISNAIRQWR